MSGCQPNGGKVKQLANRRLFRVACFAPDGHEDETLRRFAWGADQPISVAIPLALNLPTGTYRIVVTDLIGGSSQTLQIALGAQP